MKEGILASLPAKTKAEVAAAVGRTRDDSTVREAWKELEAAEQIARDGDGWVVVVVPPKKAATTTTPLRLIEGTATGLGVE